MTIHQQPAPAEATAASAQPGCPRCTGPLAQFPGDVGAASRVTHDRRISVCGDCATDEAVRDARGQAPIPPTDWPLKGHTNRTWTSRG
ncbi:hypothetical protein ACWCYY_35155 [Kitasatospora sp. NPDC001664]